jgi:hypothetical protein
MNNLAPYVVDFKNINLSPENISNFKNFSDLKDELIKNYQGQSVNIDSNSNLALILKVVHILRFCCNEILINYQNQLYSLYDDYHSPIIPDEKIIRPLKELNFNVELLPEIEEVTINVDDSFSLNYLGSGLMNYCETLRKSKSLTLQGKEEIIPIILLAYLAYYHSDSLYYQENSESKKVKIF